MLVKKYEKVMNKTPMERLLEAQRAKTEVKDNTLEGEKCQKKQTKVKKAKQKK